MQKPTPLELKHDPHARQKNCSKDKGGHTSYFSNELSRLLFPRNPHQLILARQRCSLTSPVPVITQYTWLFLKIHYMYTLKPPDRLGRPPDCRWIFGQPPDPPPGIPAYGHPVSGLCQLNKSPTKMVPRKSKNLFRYSAIFTKQLAPLRSDQDPIDNHTTEHLHRLTLPTNQFFIFDHN